MVDFLQKNSDFSPLSIICLNTRHCLKVNHSAGLHVGWLVSEALRLHFISEGSSDEALARSGVTISGVWSCVGKLSISTVLTKAICETISLNHVVLLFDGPFSWLPPRLLLLVAKFAVHRASDMANLFRVSVTFRKVSMRDELWAQIQWTSPWNGMGKDGAEAVDWEKYREQFGLPYFNTLRYSISSPGSHQPSSISGVGFTVAVSTTDPYGHASFHGFVGSLS